MAHVLSLSICLAILFSPVAGIGAPSALPPSGRLDVAATCESAALSAARRTGVPVDVLRAISLTETGRKLGGELRPWPWTVNMEGAGSWFNDRQAAQAYVHQHKGRGARSFDVGCFQLNFRWHGEAFSSIEEMFDPGANADYAARFLKELYAEFGDWSLAAGAYHSRTPKFAKKYRARFDRIRKSLDGPLRSTRQQQEQAASPAPEIAELVARQNTYPLLQRRTAAAAMASLVPLPMQTGHGRFISVAGN